MKKKVIATLLTVAMTSSMLAGCGSEKGSTQDSGNAQNQPAEEESSAASADDADEAGEVTIKLFSNLPDRKNGQGLVEQTIIDEYMAANANVTIEVEALDEEAYKTNLKRMRWMACLMLSASGDSPLSLMKFWMPVFWRN